MPEQPDDDRSFQQWVVLIEVEAHTVGLLDTVLGGGHIRMAKITEAERRIEAVTFEAEFDAWANELRDVLSELKSAANFKS